MNSLITYELERLARDIAAVQGSVWLTLTLAFTILTTVLFLSGYRFLGVLAGIMLINTGVALGVWVWQNHLTTTH